MINTCEYPNVFSWFKLVTGFNQDTRQKWAESKNKIDFSSLSHNETEVTNTSIQNTQSDGGLNTFKEYFEDTYKFESTA